MSGKALAQWNLLSFRPAADTTAVVGVSHRIIFSRNLANDMGVADTGHKTRPTLSVRAEFDKL